MVDGGCVRVTVRIRYDDRPDSLEEKEKQERSGHLSAEILPEFAEFAGF